MGLFLQVVIFPGGEERKCRAAVQNAAENPDMNIQLDLCRWHRYEKGPAVLMNEDCCGYEDMLQKLSADLPCPVMLLFTYDGDYWGYFLGEHGVEADRFQANPDYFAPVEPPSKPGNAALIARIFGVDSAAIENYLRPWEEPESGCRAYEGDAFTIGDCWQFADFMNALGFDFDLLEPQPDDVPEVPEPAAPTPPPVRCECNPLRESGELPNALTDPEYALLRMEEVRDVAPEAVRLIQNVQFLSDYKDVVPLLTAAIQAHPDRAALYILRAFCWNQLEASPSGRSRKPDMDRDMTNVLELEPNNIMALRARCPTAATTTRYKRHIGDLTRLMELDPDHWDTYLTSRAYRFHWVGDDVSARKDLEELVRRGAPRTIDLNYLLEEFGLR